MGKAEQRRQDRARAAAKADERRRVALRVLSGCDEAIERKLGELAAAGVHPTCAAGCAHCCRLEIPTSRPEAEALVAWLTANRTAGELAAIGDRLRAWLAWYRTEVPRLAAAGVGRVEAYFRHGPMCALNVDGLCSAYPVRPVACRTHLVTSPVTECDPATSRREPDTLDAAASATYSQVIELRGTVEKQGGDYMASVHQLPEWLVHLLEIEREPWRRAT